MSDRLYDPENEAQLLQYLQSERHRQAEAEFHAVKQRLVQRHSPDEGLMTTNDLSLCFRSGVAPLKAWDVFTVSG